MVRIACAVTLVFVVAGVADRVQGRQSPPRFEVASINKGKPPEDPILVSGGARRGNSWLAQSATLAMLIRAAYAPQFQMPGTIVGGPDWIDTDRFDIVARIDPSVSTETIREMAQALLAERFDLAVHRESRELPAYALVPAPLPRAAAAPHA